MLTNINYINSYCLIIHELDMKRRLKGIDSFEVLHLLCNAVI